MPEYNPELEGFRNDRYFSRAWALLTMEKGWYKPLLVLALVPLVPIVGILGQMGYMVEWSRLIAWNVNAGPKQRGVRVGECISSGWRVFVVALVWMLCTTIVGGLLSSVPKVGDVLYFCWFVFSLFLDLLMTVAYIRATVYQKIGAGLRVRRIWEMGTHDVGGLLKIFGIGLVAGIVVSIAATVLYSFVFLSILPTLYQTITSVVATPHLSEERAAVELVGALLTSMAAAGPGLILATYVANVLVVASYMLTYAMFGLWMRQFNVPAWGAESDPLPGFATEPGDGLPPAAGMQ